MTAGEARRLLENDHATALEYAEAAASLLDSGEAAFADLLLCLRRGGYCAEIAACALTSRTGRPFVVGQMDLTLAGWQKYLSDKGLLGGSGFVEEGA